MRAILGLLEQLAGLFVEDGALALAIAAVVLLAGMIAALVPSAAWASGGILVLGCLGVLVFNVMTVNRR